MNKNDVGRSVDTTDKTVTKRGWRGWLIEWGGYFAVFALVVYLFAPESWWQFGVAPAGERRPTVNAVFKTIDGDDWSLESKLGKVVVVNYWATWCGPCRVEMPGLVRFASDYEGRGVEVAGVTMDDDFSVVGPFAEQYGIKFPLLMPGSDPNLGDGNIALPTTLLYDRHGGLAKKYTGIVLESTLRSDADILLGE